MSIGVAIIGSGKIGTDLLIEIQRLSSSLRIGQDDMIVDAAFDLAAAGAETGV